MVTYGRPRLVVYTTLLTTHLCYRPDMVSNQIETDSRKFGPRVLQIVLFLFFSRGNAATLLSLSELLTLPTAKGGSRHDSARLFLLSAYTLVVALLAFPLPRYFQTLTRVSSLVECLYLPVIILILTYLYSHNRRFVIFCLFRIFSNVSHCQFIKNMC
jgi:hypothetical protein